MPDSRSEIAEELNAAGLPDRVLVYFRHAIGADVERFEAVRFGMGGEIKLGERWRPFEACATTGLSQRSRSRLVCVNHARSLLSVRR